MRHKNAQTVFIIDDDLEMRKSLCWLMKSVQLNFEAFDSAAEFLKKYHVDQRGCIILDVRMPDISGLELLDILITLNNYLPVIVITGHGDIPMAIRAMKSGAMDFILKPFNDQQLIEQIQKAIIKNTTTLDSYQGKTIQDKSIRNKTIMENFSTLTLREQKIMTLIVNGKLNKQIAYELNIAISTVELHRGRMMKKMLAKNIAQLVKMSSLLDM